MESFVEATVVDPKEEALNEPADEVVEAWVPVAEAMPAEPDSRGSCDDPSKELQMTLFAAGVPDHKEMTLCPNRFHLHSNIYFQMQMARTCCFLVQQILLMSPPECMTWRS